MDCICLRQFEVDGGRAGGPAFYGNFGSMAGEAAAEFSGRAGLWMELLFVCLFFRINRLNGAMLERFVAGSILQDEDNWSEKLWLFIMLL